MSATFRFIGRGVYSLREAHCITGVSTDRIRRWTTGYRYISRRGPQHLPPVIANTLSGALGITALDFADLLEVRFLNAFLEHGVSWKAIRIASRRAQQIVGLTHPFSSRRFSTDGRTILARFVEETGDAVLLNLARSQYEMYEVISQHLFGEIEFDEHDSPTKWWPVDGNRRIVIDPQRAFGAPIVDAAGVPTRILANAVRTEGSVEFVAKIFNVDPVAVGEACAYETRLAGT